MESMATSHNPHPRSLFWAVRGICPNGYRFTRTLHPGFTLWSGILLASTWLPPYSPSQT
jgi:hypothetical protein